MTFRVSFRPRAETDLRDLYDYIADEAGPAAAGTYVDRIEKACLSLEASPQRGTKRDDLRPGIRTMGFERRATIVFRVMKAEVIIVRILYGGRDIEALVRNEPGA